MSVSTAPDSDPETLFKDPVHGYIRVPKDLARRFIDTAIFQRLRHIEQTSMRPLFPGARHDRFIHSLGVYHLGRQVYDALERNTADASLKHELRNPALRLTFHVACLMHDCGHAPFSHTFEGFYNYSDASKTKRAYVALHRAFRHEDFKVESAFAPAPHEAFSAVILGRHFKKDARDYSWDPLLAARMITGCTYPTPRNDCERVHNAVVGLLNGDAIDCDKLDYIVRDTWSSGVKNTAVDIERLVSSFGLVRHEGRVRICHHKSALSVIQSVIDARNYLYEWVYNHHTVLYYSELLRRSLKKLAVHLSPTADRDRFWETVFSEEAFSKVTELSGFHVFMPTDGDLQYLLKAKARSAAIDEVEELRARIPARVALWKTYAEFRRLFAGTSLGRDGECCRSIARKAGPEIAKKLGCPENDVIVCEAVSKHYSIGEGDIWIMLRGSVVSYTDIFGQQANRPPQRFFYVFIPKKAVRRRDDMIDLIRGMER